MSAPMSGYERETVIIFNVAEKEASVTTFANNVKKKLVELAEKRPNEVKIIRGHVDVDDEMMAYIPKSWVKLKAPRLLSDEQQEQMRERGRRLYQLQLEKKMSISNEDDILQDNEND